jgi:hypothetical protein
MVSRSLAINAKALWPLYRVSATTISSVTRGSRLWCSALSSELSNWRSGGEPVTRPIKPAAMHVSFNPKTPEKALRAMFYTAKCSCIVLRVERDDRS